MKFIGQFIQHFISRFKSDVYLENISSGTIASGGNLGLDSNNKIVKAAEVGSAVDLTSEVTGTLPLANGGTGQTSRQAAIDALAGGTTNGRYLQGDGDNIVLATIDSADVPTLNQNTTGSAATLTTARAINGVNFDGSAAITIPTTKVYGSTIKLLPRDFLPNEDGGTSKGVFMDDTAPTGLKPGIADMELVAITDIPEGFKATHVDIYAAQDLTIEAFEMNVNASGLTSKGSGTSNTTLDITDVNATATNYLAIIVTTTATSNRVWGGGVTIAAQ